MTFDEVLDQVRELLQQRGRLTYGAVKRRFDLDEAYLEDIKGELIEAEQVAKDEDGKVLVWTGGATTGETENRGNGESEKKDLAPPAPLPFTPHVSRAEGERRQLTVMFIDLVGSMTLSQQLDPEEYHVRVVAYQDACRAVIARYEGHIAQYLGDGVLAYFGYPTAHEDDAVRAVRSGLEIVTAVSQLTYTPPLQVRISVHTGPVVVGEIGAGERTERLALGETPNIAARVQGMAEPDTVVMSAVMQRLVQGLFKCQDLGLQTLKGISTPLSLYRIIGESVAQSRFEVAVATGLTPLVGREEELSVLQQRWEQAKAGAGQVVLLSGEPGIGKSRLVQELKERVSAEGAPRIEFRCSPYHQNSALYPIIDHLQRLLRFAREDTPTVKLEKLQHTLSQYHFPQADTFPLLAALLSLPHPEGFPQITVSPQKQKEKTQAVLVAWLIEEAEQAAMLCAWEDLHWADPSTLEVLTLLLDQAPMTRLLAVLTFRPEFTPPWGNRSHLNQMTLSRLGRSQVEAMVERVTGGKALPTEVVQQIVAKTDGVPLFVEELTKTVIESIESVGSLGSIESRNRISLREFAIPTTLHDSLMARLDRLGSTKEIAQLGATLGREFSYELLHAVSPLDESSLQQSLRQLVEAELLYQRGLPPQARYLFKHALVQDTAYQSLLKSRRQQLHQQIARVLEERFTEAVETQPELLAHHYTEAGLIEQALPYWQKAGERASQRSANMEAVSHLTTALELLKTLPDTPEHIEQELSLQITLAVPLMVGKEYAAPEVERAYTRARELCQQVGETPQLFSVLHGLWGFYEVRAEHKTAHELGERCLSLSQQIQDPALLLESYAALGQTLFFLAELSEARVRLEQGIALYGLEQYHSHAFLYGHDPGMQCLAHAAFVLWYLGYPDQALKRMHEALTLAQELSHPHTLVFTLFLAAQAHYLWRDEHAAQERTEALIALSREQKFPFWSATGIILQGWALVRQEQGEEGIIQIRHGLEAYRATGAEIARIWFLLLLAEAYRKVGQDKEGLTILDEALVAINKTGEHIYEAALYWPRGELTLQSQTASHKSKVEEAVEYFLKAIEIARKQQARSLELRAVMSLARLWQSQGKKEEARQMLAEIYGWFTEGFDTKDLQEAKALLRELSH